MTVIQRRRGIPCRIERSKLVEDARGNFVYQPDPNDFWEGRVSFVPDRGSKGEAPGQLSIDVAVITVEAEIERVNLWSRVHVRGEEWDVVTPFQYHHGTRNIRHWSAEIRRRPSKVAVQPGGTADG